MKLTIERVRALHQWTADMMTDESDEHVARHFAATLALCDEWIAARTARWDGNDLETADGRPLGAVLHGDGGVLACWGHRHEDPEKVFDTEPEARAWLEEQARAAAYVVKLDGSDVDTEASNMKAHSCPHCEPRGRLFVDRDDLPPKCRAHEEPVRRTK